MTVPRKQRGFRRIVVGGASYRWAFRPGHDGSTLVVYGASSTSARLVIAMPAWRDPWHHIDAVVVDGDALHLHTSLANAPAVVSSRFVRAAIEAGLAAGFATAPAGAAVHLLHDGERFTIPAAPEG